MDATAATPWQRVLSVSRRLVRAFESERTDDQATWTLTFRVREDKLDGGWVAECPDLPGAFAQGDTREEALRNLSDAVIDIVGLRMDEQLSAASPDSDDAEEVRIAVAS